MAQGRGRTVPFGYEKHCRASTAINEEILRQKKRIRKELEEDDRAIEEIKNDILGKTSEIADTTFTLFVLEEIKAFMVKYCYRLREKTECTNRYERLPKITQSGLNRFIQDQKKGHLPTNDFDKHLTQHD